MLASQQEPTCACTVRSLSASLDSPEASLLTVARLAEFDKRTFEVMSSMIEQGHESLFYCTQMEYREQVRLVSSLGAPFIDADERSTLLQPRPTGEADETSQLSLMSRYHPDVRALPLSLPWQPALTTLGARSSAGSTRTSCQRESSMAPRSRLS